MFDLLNLDFSFVNFVLGLSICLDLMLGCLGRLIFSVLGVFVVSFKECMMFFCSFLLDDVFVCGGGFLIFSFGFFMDLNFFFILVILSNSFFIFGLFLLNEF